MTKNIKIGAIQTKSYQNNKQAISDVEHILKRLGELETHIVCLPEQWLVDNTIVNWHTTFAKFTHIAKEFSMCIIPGAFYYNHNAYTKQSKTNTKSFIAAPVITTDGDIAGIQEKIHPYDYEQKTVTSGKKTNMFESHGVKFGVMICYDTVFAAVANSFATKGADIIVSPSRILKKGIKPWEMYIQVRALENRIPILAANVSDERFGGNSMIVDLDIDYKDKIVTTSVVHAKQHYKDSHYISKEITASSMRAYKASRKSRQNDKNAFT